MRHRYHCIYTLLLAFVAFACRDGAGPDGPPDIRNLTWTADTLAYPESFQTSMEEMWASSASDVYVVGHNSRGPGKMYHYNGEEWTDVEVNAARGGNIVGAIDLYGLHGFGPDDIWAVGARFHTDYYIIDSTIVSEHSDSALVIHFDGAAWTRQPTAGGRTLLGIGGTSPTDLWAGGLEGTLYHYDGVAWTRYLLPDTLQVPDFNGFAIDNLYFIDFAGFASNDIYALAYTSAYATNTPFGFRHLFHWDGATWTLEDTYEAGDEEDATFGSSALLVMGDQLYSAGEGLWKRPRGGGQWEQLYPVFGRPVFWGLHGNSPENILAVTVSGTAWHYNGADWYFIPEVETFDFPYFDCWTDGAEAFIVGNDNHRSIVWHGK